MNTTAQSGQPLEPVRVAIAQTAEELEAIFQFRYRIYVEEMNRVQHDADHTARRIRDPLDDSAINLIARQGSEVIGVCRVNLGQHGDYGYYTDFYEIPAVQNAGIDRTSIVTRLMVSQDLRKSRLPMDLCVAAFEIGLRHGVRWCFMDCNDYLVRFFTALGFVEYASPKDHKEYGEVRRMRLDLENHDHLHRLRSPFCRVLQGPTSSTACPANA